MGLIFDSKQQFIMYYHTAIRNVGLYTSVALAGIGGARAFLEHQKGFNKYYAMVIYLLSLGAIYIAVFISQNLLVNVKAAEQEFDDPSLKQYQTLPYITNVIDSIIFVMLLVIISGFVYKRIFNRLSQ